MQYAYSDLQLDIRHEALSIFNFLYSILIDI